MEKLAKNEYPGTPDGLIRRMDGHLSSGIGDEAVPMNVESGNDYGFGTTGTRFLKQL